MRRFRFLGYQVSKNVSSVEKRFGTILDVLGARDLQDMPKELKDFMNLEY